MNSSDLLGRIGGVSAIARELGISESQAAAGANALLPAVLGGFKNSARAQPGGVDGLGGLLGQLGGGRLLDDVLAPTPTDVSQGNGVLAQIFGSKDVSRTVATAAAANSGLDAGLLKKMLPLVAMLAAGYMAKSHAGAAPGGGMGGGVGGMLGGMLGGLTGGAATPATGGGLGGMLDMDRDGNPLDDIMRMAGKFMR